jgi:hypothetical protein
MMSIGPKKNGTRPSNFPEWFQTCDPGNDSRMKIPIFVPHILQVHAKFTVYWQK